MQHGGILLLNYKCFMERMVEREDKMGKIMKTDYEVKDINIKYDDYFEKENTVLRKKLLIF